MPSGLIVMNPRDSFSQDPGWRLRVEACRREGDFGGSTAFALPGKRERKRERPSPSSNLSQS
jgi:hypothetical protein